MIKYLNHSITECKHIETNDIWYELSYWYISDININVAGRISKGFFKTYKEAEDHHNNLLVKGLIENEK